MREISFRVWDKFLFVMHYQYEYEREILIAGGYSFGEILPMKERFEFMQFTGLLDKNGKKIFESDIFENQSGRGIIEWWPEHCCFGARNIETGQMFMITSKGKTFATEIIGNQWENPELVKS